MSRLCSPTIVLMLLLRRQLQKDTTQRDYTSESLCLSVSPLACQQHTGCIPNVPLYSVLLSARALWALLKSSVLHRELEHYMRHRWCTCPPNSVLLVQILFGSSVPPKSLHRVIAFSHSVSWNDGTFPLEWWGEIGVPKGYPLPISSVDSHTQHTERTHTHTNTHPGLWESSRAGLVAWILDSTVYSFKAYLSTSIDVLMLWISITLPP